MAITKAQAITFFSSLEKGDPFYAQGSDGKVYFCEFTDFIEFGTSGVVKFGIYIYPISQDFEVKWMNLESIGNPHNPFVDFKVNREDLIYP